MPSEPTSTDPQRRRRTLQRTAGAVVYGAASALMVKSGLGLDPWNVLHQGLGEALPLSFGMALVLVGALALVGLRALGKPATSVTWTGLVIAGASADLVLAVVPDPGLRDIEIRCALLVIGVLALGLGTALSLGAERHSATRDDLWRALAARTRLTDAQAQTALEASLATSGFVLGGVVNFGTAFAVFTLGPTVRLLLPLFTVNTPSLVDTATEEPKASEAPTTVVEHHATAVRRRRAGAVRPTTSGRR